LHVLLTPIGSAGDNFPLLGIAAALARRGHDVAVATTGAFEGPVRRCGLEYIEVGTAEEYEKNAQDPDLWHPMRGYRTVARMVGEVNQRLLPIVQKHMAKAPLLVVGPTLDFASRALAEAVDLPVVTVHLQPAVMRSLHEIPAVGTHDLSGWPRPLKRALWWALDRWMMDPPLAPTVNALRAELGLGAISRLFADAIHSPLLTLALFPDWFAAPQPDWPQVLRQPGFPLFDLPGSDGVADEVEQFLAGGEPPIVFTPGSACLFGHEFFMAAVGACQRLGHRGMLLSRHAEHIPRDLPDGVAHFGYAPLSRILPRCAALVHHGGIGTTAAGLAGGVPQVIMPMSHDQPDNANRIIKLGVGARLMPRRFTAGNLADALNGLLSSADVHRCCDELAARCRATDGIARACDLIESVMPPAGDVGLTR
jgi:UDP:flavonoid glycosyltransferase YjiC (YdhE family)